MTWADRAGRGPVPPGLYTFWRRTSPLPVDASPSTPPSREVCTVRRVRTNTPLQALVTLNDPVFVEAAQALARRMQAEGGSARRLGSPGAPSGPPGRPPGAGGESDDLVRLYEDALARLPPRRGDAGRETGRLPRNGPRLDRGRQRAAEPRRGDLTRMNSRSPHLRRARCGTSPAATSSGDCTTGLGAMPGSPSPAQAASGPSAWPRTRPTRWPRGRRTSRPRRSRSSTCTWPAPPPARPVRLQAGAGQARRQALPGGVPQGPAVRVHPRAPRSCSGTPYKFDQYGEDRASGSPTACPTSREVADDLCVIRSMHTDQFNHAPAELLLYTGSRASAGRRWARGSPTASAPRTRTCPASSS